MTTRQEIYSLIGILLIALLFFGARHLYYEYQIVSKHEVIRNGVAQQLKDPSSAQFQNVSINDNNGMCGEINGKNAFGAYVGFDKFYAFLTEKDSKVYVIRQYENPESYTEHCDEHGKARSLSESIDIAYNNIKKRKNSK